MDVSTLRVLLIEDDADARDALRALLELDGHRVVAAEDGDRGIEAARRTRPDVALIDIGLPGVDGYEVARRLRAVVGRGPVLIALTGYGEAEDRQRAAEAGFDDHRVKPIDPADLSRLLATLAAQRRAS